MTSKSDAVAAELRDDYGTLPELLERVRKIYIFIFESTADKELWEKTEADILDDCMSAKFDANLNVQVKKSYAEILNIQSARAALGVKIGAVQHFVDYAYIYATHMHNDASPFYRMPRTHERCAINARALRICDKTLLKAMYDVVNDELLNDLTAAPPYLMRNDCTPDEMSELLAQVLPTCLAFLRSIEQL